MDSVRELLGPLRSALRALDLPTSPALEVGLVTLQRLVTRWQTRVRLVGQDDPRTMAVTHFADALTVLPFLEDVPEGGVVLDIGSGAGLPGLPLSLARRDLEVHLVEVDRRKAAFLATAVAELGLSRAQVHRVRAEGRPGEERLPQADVVISRAFTGVETWVPLGTPYLAPGGRLLAMLAAKAPNDAELETLGRDAGLGLERVWRGRLPGDEQPVRVIAAWRDLHGVPRGTSDQAPEGK